MNSIRAKQRGLSLISLLVALTIGVFLLAGLFDLWLQTRNTFGAQGMLAKLQDNERMALTVMANTIQSAGFYPLAENYGATPPATPWNTANAFPVNATFAAAGQYITGTTGTAPASDTIYVRFMTDTNAANEFDCLGQTHPNETLLTNEYTSNGSDLYCTVTAVAVGGATTTVGPEKVVNGVSQISVLYGVDPAGTGSVTEYLDGNTVTTSTDWPYVRSVRVQLYFANPLFGQTGQNTATFTVTRVISIPQTTVSI
jgi:type IV pilus assembly protein PilW